MLENNQSQKISLGNSATNAYHAHAVPILPSYLGRFVGRLMNTTFNQIVDAEPRPLSIKENKPRVELEPSNVAVMQKIADEEIAKASAVEKVTIKKPVEALEKIAMEESAVAKAAASSQTLQKAERMILAEQPAILKGAASALGITTSCQPIDKNISRVVKQKSNLTLSQLMDRPYQGYGFALGTAGIRFVTLFGVKGKIDDALSENEKLNKNVTRFLAFTAGSVAEAAVASPMSALKNLIYNSNGAGPVAAFQSIPQGARLRTLFSSFQPLVIRGVSFWSVFGPLNEMLNEKMNPEGKVTTSSAIALGSSLVGTAVSTPADFLAKEVVNVSSQGVKKSLRAVALDVVREHGAMKLWGTFPLAALRQGVAMTAMSAAIIISQKAYEATEENRKAVGTFFKTPVTPAQEEALQLSFACDL